MAESVQSIAFGIQMIRMRLDDGIAAFALRVARHGDWGAMADHLRHKGKVTPEIVNFLAEVLERKIRPPNNRAQTQRAAHARFRRAGLALSMMKEQGSRDDVLNVVADRFDVDRRTIERDIRELKAAMQELFGEEVDFAEFADCVLGDLDHKTPMLLPAGTNRYLISFAAMRQYGGTTG
jgi:hypothetical protein